MSAPFSLEDAFKNISEIAFQVQQKLGLEIIMQGAIASARELLHLDRILVYRLHAHQQLSAAFESNDARWEPVLGQLITTPCYETAWVERYQHGHASDWAAPETANLPACHIEKTVGLTVQANLALPLLNEKTVWGLLVAQHYSNPHEWHPLEVQYLQQVAVHLSIAIQHGNDISDRKQREDLIRNIAQGVSATTGKAFFNSLVEYLTRSLDMDQVFISEILSGDCSQMRIISGVSHGEKLDGLCIPLANSPCEQVVSKGFCLYPDRLQQRFPRYLPLQAMGGESYIGTSLVSSHGNVIGVIGMISNRAIANVQLIEEVLTIFAVRASSELERQQSDQLLRRYERIVSATPDCVSLVDRNYVYQVINQTYLAWSCKTYSEIVGHTVSELLGQEFFETKIKRLLDLCLEGETEHSIEVWQNYPDGKRRFVRATYAPYLETDGVVSGVVINVHDLTDVKLVEEALKESEERFLEIANTIPQMFFVRALNPERFLYVSPAYEKIWGRSCNELMQNPLAWMEIIHPDDRKQINDSLALQMQGSNVRREYRIIRADGAVRWISAEVSVVRDEEGNPVRFIGLADDITHRKQQTERENLLKSIAQKIRQTLDLDQILQTAVTEVRQFLNTDRVVIFQVESDNSARVIAESVAAGWTSILGKRLFHQFLVELQQQTYQHETIQGVNDIYATSLCAEHIALLEQVQVRAKLVVPIWQDDRLWGLLVAHQCRSPRPWDAFEIELQQQLAMQIAIAIQQAELYHQSRLELAERQRAETQLQQLNQELEQRVQERTQALQQQVEQERLFRLVIQNIHRSLDLQEVLTTVLYETRQTLKADRVAIYQFYPDWSGSFIAESVADGWVPLVDTVVSPVWVDSYLQETSGGRYQNNQTFAVKDIYAIGLSQCHIDLLEQFQVRAYAIAPIFLDGRLWGLLATYQNSGPREWQDWEVSLLHQIGIQTAIALRQSQLYQASQAQVEELERLHQLKDDFLSTVSHELRSPMSNIKLATEMLEISLEPLGVFDDEQSSVSRYFKVLREEEHREISLINDLLDLARLDAGTELLQPVSIELQVYIPHIAEPFLERTHSQSQRLEITIPADLPPVTIDLSYLERILTELLHNACKYTPAGEVIAVVAQATDAALEICISNSGVEIPATELDRIFDKFYRVPNSDPWRHGGTGLGLALVRKLVERLGGSIYAESAQNKTTFVLELSQGLHTPSKNPGA